MSTDGHPESHEGPGRLRPDPFFIVYKSRSGSTYLAELLIRHPEIGVAPESNLVPLAVLWTKREGIDVLTQKEDVEALLRLLYAESKFVSWGLSYDSLSSYIYSCLPLSISEFICIIVTLYCQRHYPNATVVGLKKGGWYTEHITFIRKLFPRSKFIHILRDGRAVFASSKRAIHSDSGEPFEKSPRESAWRWARMVHAFDRHSSERFALEIRYEELIRNTHGVIGEILEFLEVDHAPDTILQMLEPRRSGFVADRYAHLHDNVGKHPQLSRIDAWQEELAAGEVRSFERVAGALLERKGYHIGTRSILPMRSIVPLFSLVAKVRYTLALGKYDVIRSIESLLRRD